MSSDRAHIVLVEDNPGDVYLFRRAFQAAGLNFEMTVLEDGERAITFIRGEGQYAARPLPDLIILDLNVPKYDGGQILQVIRETERFTNVPVVIASSLPSLAGGSVANYVRKPSSLDEFLRLGVDLKQMLLERKRERASSH